MEHPEATHQEAEVQEEQEEEEEEGAQVNSQQALRIWWELGYDFKFWGDYVSRWIIKVLKIK